MYSAQFGYTSMEMLSNFPCLAIKANFSLNGDALCVISCPLQFPRSNLLYLKCSNVYFAYLRLSPRSVFYLTGTDSTLLPYHVCSR